jgi:hypothetical protein
VQNLLRYKWIGHRDQKMCKTAIFWSVASVLPSAVSSNCDGLHHLMVPTGSNHHGSNQFKRLTVPTSSNYHSSNRFKRLTVPTDLNHHGSNWPKPLMVPTGLTITVPTGSNHRRFQPVWTIIVPTGSNHWWFQPVTDLVLGHPGIYSNLLELQHTIMYFTTLWCHLTRANAGLSS